MAKRPPQESPENSDQQEMEERIKRMFDPNEPDPVEPAFEVIKDDGSSEPATAPEIKDGDPIKLPVSIEIKSDDDSFTEKPPENTKKSSKPAKKKIAVTTPVETAPEILPVEKPEEAKEIESVVATDSGEAEEVAESSDAEPVSKEPEEIKTEPAGDTQSTAEEPLSDSLHDPATEKAVDDIVAHESDDLLAHEDEKIAQAFSDEKPKLRERIKTFLSNWWHNPLERRLTIGILLLALMISFIVPTSRYFVLNIVGVRSNASVIVLDDSTQQPLRNVSVNIRGKIALTDENGNAQLTKLKLGRTDLLIEKRGFAPLNRRVTLGWGGNPLGDKRLTPVGSQYSFQVNDFLSGKPLQKVEAVSGEASAFSDDEGKIKLTLDKLDDEPFEVIIKGDSLREEKLKLEADDKSVHKLRMVPVRKHAFISKRSGKYDVYKIDIDGKNEELVLKGTGSEKDDMVLVPHPSKEVVALVSTRGNVRNRDGFLLSTLTLINLENNNTDKVAQSERIHVIDWIGDRVIYVRIMSGTSAVHPKRHRLISYDYQTFDSKEIAASNYFNDVVVAAGTVYFAPSSAYQTDPVALYRVKADGSDQQIVLAKETWNIFRTSYDQLTLATGKDWYEYYLSTTDVSKLGGEPANLRSRVYVDSPDHKRSVWIDPRDGKGVLIPYDIPGKKDKELLHTQSGLKNPIRWLNNTTIVFRVSTDQETADYAVSVDGGEPKKIRDVTNTSGIDNWYYY